MSMTVKRTRAVRTPRVMIHKTADVRGGVSVATSELGGDYLPEGAVLSAPVDGICHVVKVAVLTAAAAAADKQIKVAKHHCFKAGDAVMAAEGGVAVKVESVDSSGKTSDTITLSAALGALAAGGAVALAAEVGDDGAALKYAPQSVNGTGKNFSPTSNLDTDAWLIGVTKGNVLPSFVEKGLKGIVNI